MSEKTLADIAREMRDIDIAMLMTHTDAGAIAGRPMSNNREVDYSGESYYFTSQDSRIVRDIERFPQVTLAFQRPTGLFGKPGLHINVEGSASVVRDKKAFVAHWSDDLDRWFQEGPETPGLAMIKVRARRVHYWNGNEDGEVQLSS